MNQKVASQSLQIWYGNFQIHAPFDWFALDNGIGEGKMQAMEMNHTNASHLDWLCWNGNEMNWSKNTKIVFF